MTRALRSVAISSWAVVAAAALPGRLAAQAVDIRFLGIDMYGGTVLPVDSRLGVAFGTRIGLGDLFGRGLRMGVEIDWWTAERRGAELDVRDIIGGVAFWREFDSAGWLRPFLGLSTAVHSIDTSPSDGGRVESDPALAERLDGYRLGASGYAGLTFRLTQTGAIWLVVEYRYSAISQVSNHELRAGARLTASNR